MFNLLQVLELYENYGQQQLYFLIKKVIQCYPDHQAAQCYGCERGFWLVARKHHCRIKESMKEARNCGNVFNVSCCDKNIPVPSQQLFEPSRVCNTCYNSLHTSAPPPLLEFDKYIIASSN